MACNWPTSVPKCEIYNGGKELDWKNQTQVFRWFLPFMTDPALCSGFSATV